MSYVINQCPHDFVPLVIMIIGYDNRLHISFNRTDGTGLQQQTGQCLSLCDTAYIFHLLCPFFNFHQACFRVYLFSLSVYQQSLFPPTHKIYITRENGGTLSCCWLLFARRVVFGYIPFLFNKPNSDVE